MMCAFQIFPAMGVDWLVAAGGAHDQASRFSPRRLCKAAVFASHWVV